MIAAILSEVKTWILDDPEDADNLSELDEMDVQRRINEVERKTTELREQIESLHDRYRSTVEQAERVHEPELELVRENLAAVLKHTALVRAKFLKNLRMKCFLHKLALAKRSDTSIGGFDVNLDASPTVIRDPGEIIRDPGEIDMPRDFDTSTIGSNPEPDPEDLDAWGERELGDVEACVDDVVTAARSDDPVPTLIELFDTVDNEFDVSIHDQGSNDGDPAEADGNTRGTDTTDGESGDDENGVTGAGQD